MLSCLITIKSTPPDFRDILMIMSLQKNFENDQRAKRKAETIETETKEKKGKWMCKKEKGVDSRVRDSKPP